MNNQKRPEARILYTTSEQFTNDLVNSIKDDETQKFRDKYRNADLLIVDDIQFISGKKETTTEFFQLFNELLSKNKQVVYRLTCLNPHLCSRMSCSGMIRS